MGDVAHLLLVMQALVVVLQDWRTFLLSRDILRVCVDNVAGQDLLPEWKAPGWTYLTLAVHPRYIQYCLYIGGWCAN